ncbi:glycoside hydrolase family 17 protein [Amanita thiersii Skay4041]|uniref:Glycoside hydrolase family 17 protein n=1 Tax=Amanita thiersii Skay4041 TaxID=703135 RepID=A0A2A9NDG6_9AGAR|nr:glycoside hydrolase family 17 protein [Amanita thiersii Skay4041]
MNLWQAAVLLLPIILGSVKTVALPAKGHSDDAAAAQQCFPALNFRMPANIPPDSALTHWWCDPATEHAFLGFSYEVTACHSLDQLRAAFHDIRNHFRSRYVRLRGACDRDGFYDDIVEAAWENSLVGFFLLICASSLDLMVTTCGLADATDYFASLNSNRKAKFVTRVLQFGSEPLFDNVLPHKELAKQVAQAKTNLSSVGIPVTVSELAFGYQERDGAQDVLDAVDSINIHMLPYLSQQASTARNAWPLEKKMYFDENGWPSVTSEGVQPHSPDAVADVPNEHDYYVLLDQHCEDLKAVVGGGVGWFAHIYNDNQELGYGIYDQSGNSKFPFNPRTSQVPASFIGVKDMQVLNTGNF